jgi:dTDP-4-dehydrorhamnose 3,5-epimerase
LYPDAIAVDRDELDITNAEAVAAFDWDGASAIINAAAYTNVDGTETNEDAAMLVNAAGVQNLADAATDHGLILMHVSTDYVFDGSKDGAYTEDDSPHPQSAYGRTKAAGDAAAASTLNHYIVRTSWVVGEGNNFVRIMLGLGAKGVSPAVVNDQIGRPTFTPDLAAGIAYLLEKKPSFGIYNLTNEGTPASWADVAREVFKDGGFDQITVTDTTTAEYFADKPQAAKRPLNSVLDLAKIEATGFTPRDWKEALADYVTKEIS